MTPLASAALCAVAVVGFAAWRLAAHRRRLNPTGHGSRPSSGGPESHGRNRTRRGSASGAGVPAPAGTPGRWDDPTVDVLAEFNAAVKAYRHTPCRCPACVRQRSR